MVFGKYFKWYVINTYTGFEISVKKDLIEKIRKHSFEKYFKCIIIPMETKAYNFEKTRIKKNKVFPGYIIIKVILTCRTWLLIKEIPKVIGFLGIKEVPHILNNKDIKNVYNVLKKNYYIKKHEKYKIGSCVKIIDGPFANFCGVIKDINMGRKKARIQLSILGRETSIELQFTSFDEIK